MKRGTQTKIAESIGKSQSTVSRNIKKNDIPTIVEGLKIESSKTIEISNDIRNINSKC